MNGDLRNPAPGGRAADVVGGVGGGLASLGVLANSPLGVTANCTFDVRYSCSGGIAHGA
jgi:hypothetical protein